MVFILRSRYHCQLAYRLRIYPNITGYNIGVNNGDTELIKAFGRKFYGMAHLDVYDRYRNIFDIDVVGMVGVTNLLSFIDTTPTKSLIKADDQFC